MREWKKAKNRRPRRDALPAADDSYLIFCEAHAPRSGCPNPNTANLVFSIVLLGGERKNSLSLILGDGIS